MGDVRNYVEKYLSSDENSDSELQRKFALGELKSGLHVVKHLPVKETAKHINDVKRLRECAQEVKLKLPWLERLDSINSPAAMAPEMAAEIEEHRKTLEGKKVSGADLVHNDFYREMMFYRQAQTAVLEGIPRLHDLGIPTQRPDDYFAEMAKSDEHMNKVREKIQAKHLQQERREKARKMRELKKFGKKVQIEVQQQKQKEKRQMLQSISSFRKGQLDTLDFLNVEREPKPKTGGMGPSKRPNYRRIGKDKKYGFGGQKKRSKKNTKESYVETNSVLKKGRRNPKKKMFKSKRPGKNRRKKMKAK